MMILLSYAFAGGLLEPQLQALVHPAIEANRLGTVTVGVTRKGDTHLHVFGPPPSTKTRYELGTATGALTGLLLAEAVRRGEVQLDDPVVEHLPWQLPPDITLRHLASHTSGWPRLPADFRPVASDDPFAGIDEADLRAAVERTPVVAPPGESWSTSVLGMAVLGTALAAAAETSWQALIEERIARPLRMTSLQVDGPHLSAGHDADGGPTKPWTFEGFAPAAGLEATPRDLLDLVLATHVPGGPLRTAFDSALQPVVPLGAQGHAGLGWMITPEGVRWQNGQTAGHHVLIATHPERELGVVVVTDRATPLADDIGFAALQLLAGQNVAPLDLSPR